MNKKLISMAVGAALVAGTAVAQAAEESMAPTVYGKIHVSYGALKEETTTGGVKTTDTDNIQFREHASRLGVKGSVPISDSLSATYGLEYGLPGIDGSTVFSNRNQYVGLKGGFGETRFGRHDTPTKLAQGKFDEFNDTYGDFASIVLGDKRIANVLAYLSPDWSGFSFAAAIAPGEGDGTDGGGSDGPADTISVAAQYKVAGFFISGGFDSYDSKSANYESLMRVIATYGNKMFQVGGMYEDNKGNTIGGTKLANDKTAMGVSGHVTFADVHSIKLQYIMGTTDQTGGDFEETQTSIGYDFKMGKATTAYAMYTMYENKDKATSPNDKFEGSFVGIGMIQNF